MVAASTITTAAGGTVQDFLDAEVKLRTNLADPPYNGVASGSDQTTLVQTALSALASDTTLEIPAGIKFHLRSLTLPKNVNIDYRADDDLDTYFYGSDIGSGERVYFSSHSSYDVSTNPTGGIVNEWRFTAPFHPGVIVDVRKDVPVPSGYIAPNQSLLSPARASINIHDEQTPAASLAYAHDGTTYSRFDGMRLYTFRHVQRLQGIADTSWSALPALNTRVTGTLSGFPDAIGYFVSADASGTVIDWITGRFLTGMAVSTTTATSSATVTGVVAEGSNNNQTLAQHPRKGLWTCGIPAGSAADLWSVGGDVGVTKTISFGQHIEEAVTLPGYAWRRDLEGAPTVGASVRQVSDESEKRLWVYDGPKQSASPRGMLGAVSASLAFSNVMAIAPSAINVSAYPNGVTNPATGRYRVQFKRALANVQYTVQVTPNGVLSRSSGTQFYTLGYTVVDASNVDILVSLVDLAAGTVTATNLPSGGQVSVTVFNGDI